MTSSGMKKNRSSILVNLVYVVAAFIAGALMKEGSGNCYSVVDHRSVTSPSTETSLLPEDLPEHYTCLNNMPYWFKEGSTADDLASAIQEGSAGLTDKVTKHSYQYAYHRSLTPIARRVCNKGRSKKIRILEIGLGCAPGGGMLKRTPGGSANAWRHVFGADVFDLDLHIMEFDADCAKKWETSHSHVVTKVHTGDQGSKADLDRVIRESGGQPFDVIIDDGSHLNHHQILAVEHLIPHIAPGGVLVVEDIQSSCKDWAANMGTHKGEHVGGTPHCMQTREGKPTIYSKLSEWQKRLVVKKSPFPGVTNIDIGFEMAVLQKAL